MNKREEEILINLYRFRFLTRGQLQCLLRQRYHSRLIIWLKELLSTEMIGLSRRTRVLDPGIYYLENKGRRYLKSLEVNKKGLDKVWRNSKTSKQQQSHCLALADVFAALNKTAEETGDKLYFYTKTEMTGLSGIVVPHPDVYFFIENKKGLKKYYFGDIFKTFTNKREVIKRLDKYQDYYEENIWQEEVKKDFPEVILIITDLSSFVFLKKYLPKIVENYDFPIYLISLDSVKNQGFNKETLTKIEPSDE